ncbi:MAG TPA: (Fe-S)-binding protein [Candidatus Lokiarchaeia archaeon]|nr:(Fe-S)-binding protein [Candidatus Lokiarchaeia archaeon]
MKPRELLFESKLCGTCMKMCRHVCPTGQMTIKNEGTYPWSRGLVAFATRSKFLDLGKSEVEKLYQCATCKLCYTWCKPEVELDLIVEDLRADAVSQCPDCIPGNVMQLARDYERTKNLLGEDPEGRMNQIDPSLLQPTPGAPVGYFIGCVTAYRTPEIANAILRVLNSQGIEYQVLGNEENCCGGPLVRAGHRDLAQQVAEANVTQFQERGIETLIMGCPGCLHAFGIDYKKLFKLEGVPAAVHVLDFLRTRGYKPEATLPASVTFHDPCHYARHFKEPSWFEVPREVLREMGADLHEMTWHHANAQCCGAGGSLRASYPDVAMQIGERRIREALETGAEYLVSTCPLCKQHLVEAAQRVPEAKQLHIADLFELL